MNYELFIAKRIIFGDNSENKISKPIVRIAIMGVALGLAVMLLAIAIVTGFQKEIRDKVIGFGGHILITNYDSNSSYEVKPIDKKQNFYPSIDTFPGVKHIQIFATKAGIIKTNDAIEGIVLKGIGSDFDWNFFKNKIIEGNSFLVNDSMKSNAVLISKYTAQRLKLKVGNDLLVYFIQQPPRMRKFKVSGIYETGLEDFDKIYVLCDIAHIQKLNDWTENQVGGFEVLLNDFNKIDEMGKKVYAAIGYNLNAKTIKEVQPQIFDWLGLQNINVIIIIVLMVLVAGINMISALLIIILERTQMIGIIKALGAKSWSIRKIFLYTASYLIGIGLLLGNLIGIILCLLQKYFGIVTLDQSSYYVSVVPIHFSIPVILLLNAGTLLVCVAMLIIPSYIITKITPIKAIRFS